MMKRTVTLLLALVTALTAASCGNIGSSTAGGSSSAADTPESRAAETPAPESSAPEISAPQISAPQSTADAPAPAEPVSGCVTFEKNSGTLSEGFKTAAADFSLELLKKACAEQIAAGENALVSPESVMLALGLAANGAGGQTLQEFETLLGGDMESLNSDLSALMTAAAEDEDIDFGIANSIWVRDDAERISIKRSYAEVCKRRLDAESFLEPFDSSSVDRLNGWVSEKTRGMINSIKDSFEPDEVAVLLNCIAFEAKWETEYQPEQITEDSCFFISDDEYERCTMLSSVEKLYLSDDRAQGFIKPYKGGRYAFAAMLPDADISLSDYISSMTGEKFTKLIRSATDKYTVNAGIPEFKFDWGESIADSIRSMGLSTAFTDGADFSNMTDAQISISDIIHRTHIEVDSNGTKAAAVTAVTMRDNCVAMPDENEKTVILSRPFMFAIVDLETELPVFIGAVNTVSDKN